MFYDREIKITCWSSATSDFGAFRVNHALSASRWMEKGVTATAIDCNWLKRAEFRLWSCEHWFKRFNSDWWQTNAQSSRYVIRYDLSENRNGIGVKLICFLSPASQLNFNLFIRISHWARQCRALFILIDRLSACEADYFLEISPGLCGGGVKIIRFLLKTFFSLGELL